MAKLRVGEYIALLCATPEQTSLITVSPAELEHHLFNLDLQATTPHC